MIKFIQIFLNESKRIMNAQEVFCLKIFNKINI